MNFFDKYINAFRQAYLNRDKIVADKYKLQESEFLSSSLSIQETPLSPLPRVSYITITVLTMIALAWSILSEIDIVVNGSGVIKDANHGTQNIQVFDTVVVRKILVKEGQVVKKGQALLEFDKNITEAEVEKNIIDLKNFTKEIIIKKAILKNTQLNLSIQKGAVLIENENQKFSNQEDRVQIVTAVNEYFFKLLKFDTDIRQKEAEIETIKQGIIKQKMSVSDLKLRVKDYKSLSEDHNISRHLFEDKKTQLNELENDLEISKLKIKELEVAVTTASAAKTSFEYEYKLNLLNSINELQGKIDVLNTELRKANTKLELMNVVAPVDGKVQQLIVNTEGAVIPSSTQIMQIVPIESNYTIEALLTNKDIMLLKNNDKSIFKVDAFPYSKFGVVNSHILNISDDTIEIKDSKDKFYKIKLNISDNDTDLLSRGIFLKAGMTGTVSFVTGQRKIIDYLLSPLTEYKAESLREP